jgi:hypothetical protein
MMGTVETGAMFAHTLLRKAWPDAKFVTIRRSRDEVAASLARFGVNDIEDELIERDRHLDELEATGRVARIPYEALSDAGCCADIFEGLLGVPFDFRHWRAMAATNLQVDVPARLARLAERHDEIAALKADCRRLLGQDSAQLVSLVWEPFAGVVDDVLRMGAQHSLEVNGGVADGHPFKLNVPLLLQQEQAGVFKFMGARVNGELVGYLMWTFYPDPESEGVMIADQGPWFVIDDPRLRRLHLGKKMLDRGISDALKAGFHNFDLHHQINGRGANLGAMFTRMGATEYQRRYRLRIGG